VRAQVQLQLRPEPDPAASASFALAAFLSNPAKRANLPAGRGIRNTVARFSPGVV